MVKRIYTKLILLAGTLFILVPIHLEASHVAGAQITYKYLRTDGVIPVYLVRLSVYRDCEGIHAPFPLTTIQVSSSTCGGVGLNQDLPKISDREVFFVCSNPADVNSCDGGSVYGIQEHIYEAEIALPQCADWKFGWTLCCRNYDITNLFEPEYTQMYVESFLNNLDDDHVVNSSPMFGNVPIIRPSSDVISQYNHGSLEPDGDDLSYSLVKPKHDESTDVTYLYDWMGSLYTANTPFGDPCTTGACTDIDVTTGVIEMDHPPASEIAVLAVKVEEERDGVVIGYVIRDIQVNVIDGDNNPPILNGFNGTANFSIPAYADAELCFDIPSSDPDGPPIFLSTDLGTIIPEADFSFDYTTNPSNPELQVCWTPTPEDVGEYCFLVTAIDDECDVPAMTVATYCITVEPCLSVGVPEATCEDQSVNFFFDTELTVNSSNILWDFGDGSATTSVLSPDHTYTISGSYDVSLTFTGLVRGCDRTIVNTIHVVEAANCLSCTDCIASFAPFHEETYVLSAWVKETEGRTRSTTYNGGSILLSFPGTSVTYGPLRPKGQIIDGWQRIEEEFTIPIGATDIDIELVNDFTVSSGRDVFFDDIRIHPFKAHLKSFVYDPITLRLMAELDENNYATFYEYDEEGALRRVKKETERGIKTIQESLNHTSK